MVVWMEFYSAANNDDHDDDAPLLPPTILATLQRSTLFHTDDYYSPHTAPVVNVYIWSVCPLVARSTAAA